MSKMEFNFYGASRFNTAGKHPSELMSEGEICESYEAAEARARDLTELWNMDVEYSERGSQRRYFCHKEKP